MLSLRWVDDASRSANQDETLDSRWVLKCSMKADAGSHAVAEVDSRATRVDKCVCCTGHICYNML